MLMHMLDKKERELARVNQMRVQTLRDLVECKYKKGELSDQKKHHVYPSMGDASQTGPA